MAEGKPRWWVRMLFPAAYVRPELWWCTLEQCRVTSIPFRSVHQGTTLVPANRICLRPSRGLGFRLRSRTRSAADEPRVFSGCRATASVAVGCTTGKRSARPTIQSLADGWFIPYSSTRAACVLGPQDDKHRRGASPATRNPQPATQKFFRIGGCAPRERRM